MFTAESADQIIDSHNRFSDHLTQPHKPHEPQRHDERSMKVWFNSQKTALKQNQLIIFYNNVRLPLFTINMTKFHFNISGRKRHTVIIVYKRSWTILVHVSENERKKHLWLRILTDLLFDYIEDLLLMYYLVIVLLETIADVYMLLLTLNVIWKQIIAQHVGATVAVVQLESFSNFHLRGNESLCYT